jgi:mono/diheme cytochrome c family protein
MAGTLLERGTYLTRGVVACGNCHAAKGGPMAKHELAGGSAMKKGPIDAITPNLTPIREPVPAAGPMPN